MRTAQKEISHTIRSDTSTNPPTFCFFSPLCKNSHSTVSLQPKAAQQLVQLAQCNTTQAIQETKAHIPRCPFCE